MAESQDVSQSAKTPADFLKSIKGKPVVVKLNSGVDYRGKGSMCLRTDTFHAAASYRCLAPRVPYLAAHCH